MLSGCDSGDVPPSRPSPGRPRLRAGLTVAPAGRRDARALGAHRRGLGPGRPGRRVARAARGAATATRDLRGAPRGAERRRPRARARRRARRGRRARRTPGSWSTAPVDLDDAWANQRAYLEQFATPGRGAEQMLAAVRATTRADPRRRRRRLLARPRADADGRARARRGRPRPRRAPRTSPASSTRRRPSASRKIEALGVALRRAASRPRLPRHRPDGHRPRRPRRAARRRRRRRRLRRPPHGRRRRGAVARACVPAAHAAHRRRLRRARGPRRPDVAAAPPASPARAACGSCASATTPSWSTTAEEARRLKPRRAAVTVAQAQLVAALAATEILHLRAGLDAGHRRARRRARPAHPALLPEPGAAAARLPRCAVPRTPVARKATGALAPRPRREEVNV